MKKIATLAAILAISSTAFAADEVLNNIPADSKTPVVADASATSTQAAPAADAKKATKATHKKHKKHAKKKATKQVTTQDQTAAPAAAEQTVTQQ
jgi:hypothetical protein